MSNDGRSIGDHLRDTEMPATPDSSADSSATRQPARGEDVTNRAPTEERPDRQRKPRGDKGRSHAQ